MDNSTIFWVISIILFIGAAVSAYYFAMAYSENQTCSVSESTLCPLFFCPDIDSNTSGTECYDIKTKIGEKVAYRHSKNSSTPMCQNYQITNAVQKK